MKINNILMLAALLLPASWAGYAQNETDYSLHSALQGGIFSPTSLEARSMETYGGAGVSLVTGTISEEIGLYTYSDKDFTIPVSIVYSSSGYKPGLPDGAVGHGWALQAGGVITREVRGIPDEVMDWEYVQKTKGDGQEWSHAHLAQVAATVTGVNFKTIMAGYYASQRLNVSGYAVAYEGNSVLDSLDYAYTGEFGREFLLCIHNKSRSD